MASIKDRISSQEPLSIEEIDALLVESEMYPDPGYLNPDDHPGMETITLPPKLAEHFRDKPQMKESPTSIGVFMRCPLRWYAERHMPTEPGSLDEEYQKPWAPAGNVVHRAAQVFMDEPKELRNPKLVRRIGKYMEELLKDGDVEDGLLDTETATAFKRLLEESQIREQGAPGRRFLEMFWNIVHAGLDNILEFIPKPESVDVVATEGYMSHYINGVRIGGKYDLISLDESGLEVIDDWKTGRPPAVEDEEDIHILNLAFLGLGIYAWLRYKTTQRENLTPTEISAVRLLYVNHLDRVRVDINPNSIRVMERFLDLTTSSMKDMAETGKISAYPGNKTSNPCRYCPIIDVCPTERRSSDKSRLVDGEVISEEEAMDEFLSKSLPEFRE